MAQTNTADPIIYDANWVVRIAAEYDGRWLRGLRKKCVVDEAARHALPSPNHPPTAVPPNHRCPTQSPLSHPTTAVPPTHPTSGRRSVIKGTGEGFAVDARAGCCLALRVARRAERIDTRRDYYYKVSTTFYKVSMAIDTCSSEIRERIGDTIRAETTITRSLRSFTRSLWP